MTLSDGRRQTGPFSQNHARLSFERSRMHQSWSRHRRSVTCPLPRPFSIGRFHHGNGTSNRSWLRRKGEKEAKEGEERGKGQTRASPLTSYILQHRSGALGEDRAGAKWIWHFEQLRPLSSLNLSIPSGWSLRPRVCSLASITLRVIV